MAGQHKGDRSCRARQGLFLTSCTSFSVGGRSVKGSNRGLLLVLVGHLLAVQLGALKPGPRYLFLGASTLRSASWWATAYHQVYINICCSGDSSSGCTLLARLQSRVLLVESAAWFLWRVVCYLPCALHTRLTKKWAGDFFPRHGIDD